MKKCFFWGVLSCLLGMQIGMASLYGSPSKLVGAVREITVNDGLSLAFVRDIYQDTDGFFWFLTEEGLDRHDGYYMHHYNFRKLGSQFAYGLGDAAILEDCASQLWITSHSETGRGSNVNRYEWGIEVLDPVGNRLVTQEVLTDMPFSLADISLMAHLPGEWILIGTQQGGLFGYDGSFFPIFKDPQGTPIQNIESRDGNLYVRMGERLLCLDRKGQILEERTIPFLTDRITIDVGGNIWCIVNRRALPIQQRLFFIPKGSEEVIPFSDLDSLLPENQFSDFWVTSRGSIIVAQEGILTVFSSQGHRLFNTRELFGSQLDQLPFSVLYFDRSGAIWTNSSNGVLRISIRPTPFQNYLQDPPASLRGMEWVNDSQLLMASYSGLWLWNTRAHEVQKMGQIPILDGLGICRDTAGAFWMGAHAGKVYRISPDLNSVKTYNLQFSKSTQSCWIPFSDRRGNVWFGLKKGLARYEAERDEIVFQPALPPFEHFNKAHINGFYENGEGIWTYSRTGIYLLDQEGKVKTWFEELSGMDILHIHEDKKGHFWIATRGDALIRWDPITRKKVQYTLNLFARGIYYAVLEDAKGLLWIPTNNTLIRFDPATEEKVLFRKEDGLMGDEFNFLASARDSRGRFILGGVNGFSLFHPDSVSISPSCEYPIQVISCMTWEARQQRSIDRRQDLYKPGGMVLKPSIHSVEVAFSIPGLVSRKGSVKYAYKLEGRDEFWTIRDEPIVRFSNLLPGRYTLYLAGMSADGRWIKDRLAIPIWVKKPFYLRFWFWLAIIMVLSLIGYIYFRIRIWRYQQRQRQMEEEIQHRTRELEKLNKVKDHLFLILAHELKNPVLSFQDVSRKINYLLKSGQLEVLNELGNELEYTAANTSNLLENLLHWAKTQRGAVVIHPREITVGSVFEGVHTSYKERCENKKIDLQVCTKEDQGVVWSDPSVLQIALRNLVDNAVKYTLPGGKIHVFAQQEQEGGWIRVKDTGVGINQEKLRTLFEFGGSSNPGTGGEQGTGIGLLLVKEMMNLQGGRVTVQSEPGKGSVFSLWFSSNSEKNNH